VARAQTIIKIPGELAQELDRVAGTGRRSAYAVDVLWRDIRRARQREALKVSSGAWKAENHPELAKGGAAYVEQIRSERDRRFEAALRRGKR
jgi:hypothetical protein